jgi:hypothetical protein
LNSSFQRNKDKPVSYAGQYSTDVLASKVYGFIDNAPQGDKPFFLVAAPNAPHSNVAWDGDGKIGEGNFAFGAPISAERHKHLFPNEVVPRTPHFNPESVSLDSAVVVGERTDVLAIRRRLGSAIAAAE